MIAQEKYNTGGSMTPPKPLAYAVERVKFRALHKKGDQAILPVGGAKGFFGWHTVPADATAVVITEGEYDGR
jgi:twinkle protein